jgi:N-carbamoylputrescine amidase
MALAGADLLIYPTAIGWDKNDTKEEHARQLDAWITVQRGHAVANGLPLISCNRIGFETAPNSESGIDFWGNSFIVGSQGEFLVHANSTDTQILTTEIDLVRSETVRRIWPFLRDRRIDAFGDLTKRFID